MYSWSFQYTRVEHIRCHTNDDHQDHLSQDYHHAQFVFVFMPWYGPALIKSMSILLSYIFYYFSTTECILLYNSRTDEEVHSLLSPFLSCVVTYVGVYGKSVCLFGKRVCEGVLHACMCMCVHIPVGVI